MIDMTPLLYGILILIGGWIAIFFLFRGIKALDNHNSCVDIDDAMRLNIELMKEISELNKEISFLRNQPLLAKEAIDRFCHPSLSTSAFKWLESQRIKALDEKDK